MSAPEPADVSLRPVTPADIEAFHQHQVDPEARRMAAFVRDETLDPDAHALRWRRLLDDASVLARTIVADAHAAGHIASFYRDRRREVTYWIDRRHWGRGIATRALRAFLHEERTRPLYASAAADNTPSTRVLRRCGFTVVGQTRAWAEARGMEIDEIHYALEDARPPARQDQWRQ